MVLSSMLTAELSEVDQIRFVTSMVRHCTELVIPFAVCSHFAAAWAAANLAIGTLKGEQET